MSNVYVYNVDVACVEVYWAQCHWVCLSVIGRGGRQLQRAGSLQLDTSRRSSMSDIIIEDIDGNFVALNDKVLHSATAQPSAITD